MEPTENRPDDLVPQRVAGQCRLAAMEPTENRPDDGSPNLSRLTSVNGALCERSVLLRPKITFYGVVKVPKHPLTCVRVLPGVRLTTSALAGLGYCRNSAHSDRVHASDREDSVDLIWRLQGFAVELSR